MRTIHMVDLGSQTQRIRKELDSAIGRVMDESSFINGKEVREFANMLAEYLKVKHVIPCANGTDALQMALMALDLPEGSEVIMPGFSYAALAEVCGLLKLKPVFADVDPGTFNIDPLGIERCITPATKVIAPVHLFGQCSDIETILAIAEKHNLFVLEDNAQSIGADYTFSDGKKVRTGCMGHIGTTSFFPSKNLGCFGDGGAVFTNNDSLAERLRMIGNHGQKTKYYHDITGINSRLDTMQAAVLMTKLPHLDSYIKERQETAAAYDRAFAGLEGVQIPERQVNSTHVFHQYTLKLTKGNREDIRAKLAEAGIPTMVYYPLPLHKQKAYLQNAELPISEALCANVLSLPMGTDMDKEQINYITNNLTHIIQNQ